MNIVRATLLVLLCVSSRESAAIVQVEGQETGPEVVIVNGSLSSRGSGRDANPLRGPVASLQIPYPESFSAERLLNQHKLPLASTRPCGRELCLVGEAMRAQLLAQPDAQYLVGLGFASDAAAALRLRAPLNLVAVVDTSESMQGAALKLVKRSLSELVQHLGAQDQLSIVVYGSTAHTHLPPTLATRSGRRQLLAAIDKLRSGGAASLDEGLAFGYRVASAAGNDFTGADRVLLFTDERLDEDGLTLETLLAQAQRGAQQDIGLTTVAVGPADTQLAEALGSVRGSNLLALRTEADVPQLFGADFASLVSELAHDVRISITPAKGYRIAGVYGGPGSLLGYLGEPTIEVSIATLFLSARNGGIFVSLAKQSEYAPEGPLAHVALLYTPPGSTQAVSEVLHVAAAQVTPSPALQLGHLLIDEFATLRRATTVYHQDNNREVAYGYLHAFAARLRTVKDTDLDVERRLVNSLEERLAFLSGHAGDAELVRSRSSRLWGVWRVRSVQGRTDFRANERIEFTPDSKFRFFEKADGRHVVAAVADISTNRQQILMDYSGVVYNYEVRGSELVIEERPGTLVFLQRLHL